MKNKIKITFFSNFLNHHQLPFCMAMREKIGDNFKFVATEKIPDERIKLGYEDMNKKYDFVVRSYESEEQALELGENSDIVIFGSAPYKYIKGRRKNKKITFRYSERIYKNGFNFRTWAALIKNITFRLGKNDFLLCSSAYAPNDFNLSLAYIKKCYKWGYFPAVDEIKNINKFLNNKKSNSILWAGRLIDWKHPELAIEIAKKLRDENYDFHLNIIGNGIMENDLIEKIKKYHLTKNVSMLGSMSPDEVRKYMKESQIFLFTSDKGEGWGAVLNESMNSACTVIASHEIGAVPYLLKNGFNGYIYNDGDFDDLFYKVKKCLDSKNICNTFGRNAYDTISTLWNADIAAERVLKLSLELLKGNKNFKYENGPCSIAKKTSEKYSIGDKNEDIK